MLYALDNFRDLAQPPRDDLVIRGKVLPGWAVRLLVGALLLPPLLMGIDALARLRRRHEPLWAWGVWTLASGVPFLLACLFAVLLALVGLISAAPGAPIPAAGLELGGGAIVAFVAILLVFALGWLVARPALLHATGAARVRKQEPDAAGAVVAVGLTTVVIAGALWVGNPYAAALVVPAAHLWFWALTPDLRLPRSASLAVVVAGARAAARRRVRRRARVRARPPARRLVLDAAGRRRPRPDRLVGAVEPALGLRGRRGAGGGPPPPARRTTSPTRSPSAGPSPTPGPGSLGGTGSALRH